MAHSDRPNPETLILENGDLAATADHVIDIIESLGIEHETQVHEPLYTVEQAKQVDRDKPGAHTKNLFLRNKKGRMFLLVAEQDQMIDLKGLRDKLQLTGGHLAFASTERLTKHLGVVPGSVSPLALINDHSNKVQVYIEKTLLEQEYIYLHPCRNTHTTRMRCDGLLKLLEYCDHPAVLVDF
ncbi:MAG: prolyl-tRNA synthetase associated domain-containing protein [Cocleimonas sp.]